MSRCRSSATARAGWSRSASATARCSGATRRWSRRRRRPASPTRPCARACTRRPTDLGASVAYRVGRHGRVHLRSRARGFLLPRGQHAPAGRASGDRGGVRHRSRRMDDPPGGRRGRSRRRARRLMPKGAAIEVRALCRDAACRFPPERRPPDRSRLSAGRPRRRLDRDRAPKSRRSTIRCSPRSSSTPTTGLPPSRNCGRRSPRRRSPASRPISTICAPSRRPTCSPTAGRHDGAARFRRSSRDVVEVLAPGAQSSLQELPGRLGLWHVGVPPSGPMDERSFRHANRLVGNAPIPRRWS